MPPATFGDYAFGIKPVGSMPPSCENLRLRSFRLTDWRTCLHVGTDAAWATDRGEPIVQAMLDHLRGAMRSSLCGGSGKDRACRTGAGTQKAFEALADGLTDAAREALDAC